MVNKKVTFKAGKMIMNEDTKVVKAERGQFTITMEHRNDEEKVFTVTNEATKQSEETYVFQGMTFFDKVRKTNGGRIYYLFIKEWDMKMFFWMQEPDESKDDTLAKQVNDIINFDEAKQPAPTTSIPIPVV